MKFEEILKSDFVSIGNLIKDIDSYMAHTNIENKYEPLLNHTNLTLKYFSVFCNKLNLDPVFDKLIESIISKFSLSSNVSGIIKKFILFTIAFHDLGKINSNFQVAKMGNSNFKKTKSLIDSEHSILSVYIFLKYICSELESIDNSDKERAAFIALLLSLVIRKHHGNLSSVKDVLIDKEYWNTLHLFDDKLNIDENNFFVSLKSFIQKVPNLEKQLPDDDFNLFTIIRLTYSLLTLSDYYATNEFINGLEVNDFGLIDDNLREHYEKNLYSIPYNKNLFKPDNNLSPLNKLRKELAKEVITGLKGSVNKNLFYLEAPTGFGKTNLSALLINEFLKNDKSIKKVFYVFPFTTLVEQTYNSFIDSIGLKETDAVKLHSRASFNFKEDYSDKLKNVIDYQFANFPFVFTSHIKFFDILLSNDKMSLYLLPFLINSVVVIDEIQSYDPTEWDKINYVLNKYAEIFNIKIIVMSATLPKISKLLFDKSSNDEFVYLVKDKSKYFLNEISKGRVEFDFSYVKENYSDEFLFNKIIDESENYFNKHNSAKVVVEFVKKDRAKEFYRFIIDEQNFFDEVLLLTGDLLESRKKEVIVQVKGSDKGKLLLISTQVIEAGVDVDMDLGFKDISLLDSEEQIAGRVNRNALKNDSKLFFFNTNDADIVYKKDYRRGIIDVDKYQNYLEDKNFDDYYGFLFGKINERNNDVFLKNNLGNFVDNISKLRFQEIATNFNLIKSDTFQVFVPVELFKDDFTNDELKFLETIGVDCKQKIYGEDVWESYKSMIQAKDKNRFDKFLSIKLFKPILSRYSFSCWRTPKLIEQLIHYSENGFEYGFLKLSYTYYNDIYTIETGLKTNLEDEINFF